MMETKNFKRMLYLVSYIMAAIMAIIGIILFGLNNSFSNEIIGYSWIFLLVGAYFNIRYFLYTLNNEKEKK